MPEGEDEPLPEFDEEEEEEDERGGRKGERGDSHYHQHRLLQRRALFLHIFWRFDALVLALGRRLEVAVRRSE